ncbi:hypothetical protein [Bacillus cereus group sp. BfR-BA-01345]|uniref:hypothetical protein n=1 Tax=Bacillus cereus group sp. BfR-BA-01345 TaxID=2920308 RepID=UPI001F57E814
MDNSKWMPLSNVDDDEEIWVGARVRVYNVGMNREDKENNFYEYIISVNVKINMYIFACLSMYKINHFLC